MIQFFIARVSIGKAWSKQNLQVVYTCYGVACGVDNVILKTSQSSIHNSSKSVSIFLLLCKKKLSWMYSACNVEAHKNIWLFLLKQPLSWALLQPKTRDFHFLKYKRIHIVEIPHLSFVFRTILSVSSDLILFCLWVFIKNAPSTHMCMFLIFLSAFYDNLNAMQYKIIAETSVGVLSGRVR